RRIGAVQHVEARPAGLRSEALAEHLRTEARPAHSQQDDVGEATLLDLRRKTPQPIAIGQLLLRDGQPAEPFILVGSGPERFIAGPEASYAPVLAPSLHFRRDGR